MQAYAYLRKSRLLRDQDIVSPEMQLAAVEEYAAQFGHSGLVVLTDMNKSGRKGRRERPGFNALLTAIEAGGVSAVYSYSLSRLSRSVRDIMSLADLCRQHNVAIRLARDTDPDPTTATGRAILALLGVMAQLEADLASERALDAVQARRARGDSFGTPVFADHERVIEAYREAGSATGAAKLLTSAGIPTRNGNRLWYPSAVTVILKRAAPELLPASQRRGVKAAAPFIFYRLLRCHCGTTMTGMRRADGYTSYRCTRGRLDVLHGKTHIPEGRLLAWAMAEAARLRPPTDTVALIESTSHEQSALRERLARLKVAFLAGLVGEAEMLADKAEIDGSLTQLDLQGRAVSVPGVVWALDQPVALNRALRTIWSAIQLDGNFRPVAASWLLPPAWIAPATLE
jgi:DNA invertase Pin-like site-specific DNA recombinase